MEIEELGDLLPIIGSGLPRAEGLHLTQIIGYINDQINPYTGKGFLNPELTMEAGFIWERALENAFGERIGKRLNDLECDGIFCNPDGLGYDPLDGKTPAVEEYKCTWRSMKRCPTEDMKWMMQVKAYCHVLGTTVAVMHVLYLMGDYKGSGPQGRTFRIEYTQEEIDDNWQVILDHKDATLEALEGE